MHPHTCTHTHTHTTYTHIYKDYNYKGQVNFITSVAKENTQKRENLVKKIKIMYVRVVYMEKRFLNLIRRKRVIKKGGWSSLHGLAVNKPDKDLGGCRFDPQPCSAG